MEDPLITWLRACVSLTDIASYLDITPQSLNRIRRNIHL
jgi:hypothetical protein